MVLGSVLSTESFQRGISIFWSKQSPGVQTNIPLLLKSPSLILGIPYLSRHHIFDFSPSQRPELVNHPMRPDTMSRNFTDTSFVISPQNLTTKAHWIRNTLDLQIAHSGPEALAANDLLDLDSFLRDLLSQAPQISLETLRTTRIHLAVLDICGRATRWPLKVIERAEAIGNIWEGKYGSLSQIGWVIRVEGWDEVVEKRESLVLRGLNIGKARRFGDLGFKPGE